MSAPSQARYDAVVVDNQDPERRGRLRVVCDAILGHDATDLAIALEDWIEPAFPWAGKGYGWFFVPANDAEVEIIFDEESRGDAYPAEGFIINPSYKWVACAYRSILDVPTEFTSDPAKYGQRMGIVTKSGQMILFDDFLKETVLKFGALRLGSDDAANPFVLGDLLRSILDTLFQAVQVAHNTHVHPGPSGPTGTPTVPMNLSLGPLQGESWLSGIIFGKK